MEPCETETTKTSGGTPATAGTGASTPTGETVTGTYEWVQQCALPDPAISFYTAYHYDLGPAETVLQTKSNTLIQQYREYRKLRNNIDTPRHNASCQISKWKRKIRNALLKQGKVDSAQLDYDYKFKDFYKQKQQQREFQQLHAQVQKRNNLTVLTKAAVVAAAAAATPSKKTKNQKKNQKVIQMRDDDDAWMTQCCLPQPAIDFLTGGRRTTGRNEHRPASICRTIRNADDFLTASTKDLVTAYMEYRRSHYTTNGSKISAVTTRKNASTQLSKWRAKVKTALTVFASHTMQTNQEEDDEEEEDIDYNTDNDPSSDNDTVASSSSSSEEEEDDNDDDDDDSIDLVDEKDYENANEDEIDAEVDAEHEDEEDEIDEDEDDAEAVVEAAAHNANPTTPTIPALAAAFTPTDSGNTEWIHNCLLPLNAIDFLTMASHPPVVGTSAKNENKAYYLSIVTPEDFLTTKSQDLVRGYIHYRYEADRVVIAKVNGQSSISKWKRRVRDAALAAGRTDVAAADYTYRFQEVESTILKAQRPATAVAAAVQLNTADRLATHATAQAELHRHQQQQQRSRYLSSTATTTTTIPTTNPAAAVTVTASSSFSSPSSVGGNATAASADDMKGDSVARLFFPPLRENREEGGTTTKATIATQHSPTRKSIIGNMKQNMKNRRRTAPPNSSTVSSLSQQRKKKRKLCLPTHHRKTVEELDEAAGIHCASGRPELKKSGALQTLANGTTVYCKTPPASRNNRTPNRRRDDTSRIGHTPNYFPSSSDYQQYQQQQLQHPYMSLYPLSEMMTTMLPSTTTTTPKPTTLDPITIASSALMDLMDTARGGIQGDRGIGGGENHDQPVATSAVTKSLSLVAAPTIDGSEDRKHPTNAKQEGYDPAIDDDDDDDSDNDECTTIKTVAMNTDCATATQDDAGINSPIERNSDEKCTQLGQDDDSSGDTTDTDGEIDDLWKKKERQKRKRRNENPEQPNGTVSLSQQRKKKRKLCLPTNPRKTVEELDEAAGMHCANGRPATKSGKQQRLPMNKRKQNINDDDEEQEETLIHPPQQAKNKHKKSRGSGSEMFSIHTQWNKMYNELIEYAQQHYGNIPYQYISNPSLYIWCEDQRRYFKNYLMLGEKSKNISHNICLTLDQIQKLNLLGFDWNNSTPNNETAVWTQQYQELIHYARHHEGSTNVPQNYTLNPALANWITTNRSEYKYFLERKKSNMTLEKICLLNDIGFVWISPQLWDNGRLNTEITHATPQPGINFYDNLRYNAAEINNTAQGPGMNFYRKNQLDSQRRFNFLDWYATEEQKATNKAAKNKETTDRESNLESKIRNTIDKREH